MRKVFGNNRLPASSVTVRVLPKSQHADEDRAGDDDALDRGRPVAAREHVSVPLIAGSINSLMFAFEPPCRSRRDAARAAADHCRVVRPVDQIDAVEGCRSAPGMAFK